jgi:hypothetical protein
LTSFVDALACSLFFILDLYKPNKAQRERKNLRITLSSDKILKTTYDNGRPQMEKIGLPVLGNCKIMSLLLKGQSAKKKCGKLVSHLQVIG